MPTYGTGTYWYGTYGTVRTTVQWDKPGSKQLDIDSNSPVRYPCKTGLRFAGPQLA